MIISNMIEVYNQLISDAPNADYSLFKKILNDNFDKFKYFYKIIKKLNLDNVNKIYCMKSTTHELNIVVLMNDESFSKPFLDIFLESAPGDFDGTPFDIDYHIDTHIINISISAEYEECEYYENRFNRY